MRKFLFITTLLTASAAIFAQEKIAPSSSEKCSWQELFKAPQRSKKGMILPAKWQVEGTKHGVPVTNCSIVQDRESKRSILRLTCNRSTGGIIVELTDKVDLKKTPILRWCWRVKNYPKGADGRFSAKDDQPLAIYLGMDGILSKRSVAYRWEGVTPKGFEGKVDYAGGLVKVHYITMQNQDSPAGKWITETRNVAEDFKRVYGTIPKKFAISIMGNSQYTRSNTVAEVAFVEFIPETKTKK